MPSFKMPYYMTNEEWYYYDEIKKKYVLTDKAPLKAIHSYKRFEMEQKLVQMLSYGEVDAEIEAELFNLIEMLIYLEDYYKKKEILEILDSLISKGYLSSYIYDYVIFFYEDEEFLDSELLINNENGEFPLKCNSIKIEELNYSEDTIKKEIIMNTRIDDLGLSIRTLNCLRKMGLNTVRELLSVEENAFYSVKNLGKKSFDEVILKQNEIRNRLKNMEKTKNETNKKEILERFKEIFGDIFGETEETATINAMFGWNPKKSEDEENEDSVDDKKMNDMPDYKETDNENSKKESFEKKKYLNFFEKFK